MNKTMFSRPYFIYSVSAVFLVIALAPVLCFHFFPTVDGPAHLYNAKIIRELWWGDTEMYSPFFKFNREPVPNWSGHFIAVVAGLVLPAWMVEKLIVLLIALGLPLGIYVLSRSFGATPSWRMLLLLPFIYTITLYLGFFNFMLSLVIMLFTLAWIVNWDRHKPIRYFLMVLLFTTILYFSHVLAFAIALLFAGLLLLWEHLDDKNRLIFSRMNFQRVACFVPGIIFAILFFSSRSIEGFRNKTEQIPLEDLVKFLIEGAPFVGLNGAEEVPYTSVFMIGIVVLIAAAIVFRIREKVLFAKSDLLFFFALMMLAGYFVVPDGMASGGFISMRLLLLALLFVVAWLLTFKMPVSISVLAGLMGIYVSFSTWSYRMQVASQLNNDAKNLVEMAALMTPRSVVLPLNYSTNWLHLNLAGYMGATGDLLLLENYEADFDEFPLQWNDGFEPVAMAGNFKHSRNPSLAIENYEVATGKKITCVARWLFDQNTSDSTMLAVDADLRKNYKKVQMTGQGDFLFK